MRWIALLVIMLSLPMFIVMLQRGTLKRDWALVAMGLMPFISGKLQIDAALMTWPLWVMKSSPALSLS